MAVQLTMFFGFGHVLVVQQAEGNLGELQALEF